MHNSDAWEEESGIDNSIVKAGDVGNGGWLMSSPIQL